MSAETLATLAESSATNPRVFFDISIGGKPAGKIVFELYASIVPKTVSRSFPLPRHRTFKPSCSTQELALTGLLFFL